MKGRGARDKFTDKVRAARVGVSPQWAAIAPTAGPPRPDRARIPGLERPSERARRKPKHATGKRSLGIQERHSQGVVDLVGRVLHPHMDHRERKDESRDE